MNEILRAETRDPIFKFRYLIHDLHNLLARMHVNYLQNLERANCSILRLYRGQIMARNDLENKFRLNQGNLIAMNSFLSTTADRLVARMFSGDGSMDIPEGCLGSL